MSDSKKYDNNMKGRIISLAFITGIFITIWYMLDIVLLTFILTFVFYHLIAWIQRRPKPSTLITFQAPDGFVLAVLYTLFLLILVFASIVLVPKLADFFTDLANILINFNIDAVKASVNPRMAKVIANIDFNTYLTNAGEMLATGIAAVGGFGISMFISLILSFFILLEKKKIQRFGERLGKSRISFLYDYLITFGANFCDTFGKVMKVQVTIALINSSLSIIMGFPQILGLGVMIFLLGLIPVAGVIISLLPLCLIAFNLGGISKVVAVIVMVILLHAMEAYVLNPKLMSNKTELPVCFVFIILLVGEHYMGVWGLLIGVPIFIFLLNAMEVDYTDLNKKKKHRYK